MKKNAFLAVLLSGVFALSSCTVQLGDFKIELSDFSLNDYLETDRNEYRNISAEDIGQYSGQDSIPINCNEPYFEDSELVTESFEHYSELDWLGRCGTAYACLGKDLMPVGKRGSISEIKPTGWHSVRYDFIECESLYNRCHLIGWQLSGENANKKNLITGTRYLNATLMLPYENMVADYIKETNNHVMYRVTPYFDGNDLVAKGVLMEAKSVEDDGDGICYNMFLYNVQPGVEIDYATGKSRALR